MPNFIDNFGLSFFYNDEEITATWFKYLFTNGKPIPGYYDCPTFFNAMGDVDLYVKTRKNEEGFLEVYGLDTHCCGRNKWEMRFTGIDVTPKDSLPTERAFIFRNNKDGSGLVPIHLVNADILPSFLEDDVVIMQMCAFPLDINYYADEDDYIEDQPKAKDGNRWLIADGSLMPSSFLVNHAKKEDNEEKDYSTDDCVQFRGTVTGLYRGFFAMGENEDNTFIRCKINTNFGELYLVHTIDDVKPEQVDNLKVGAVVSGVCVLSGDVAVHEYTDGIVKDFENNLRLLRQVITKGEAERMRMVLNDDSVYYSEASELTIEGANDIIKRFNYVNESIECECYTAFATITQVDSEELEYPVGTRCILISYGPKDTFDSIAFMDVTENGDIKRIYISQDSRYHFAVDEKPEDVLPFENDN